MSTKAKKSKQKPRATKAPKSAGVLAAMLECVTAERDKLKRDFESYKAIADAAMDDARCGVGLSGVSPSREAQRLKEQIKDLEIALQNADQRAQSNLKKYLELRDSPLEKAHAELQKFYTQSQDELHACRERELMRPWWKKLLGLR